jgi:signal transduction histidine kinase
LRIVLSSSALVLVALVIGTVAVAALFTAGRLRDIDNQTRAEADSLSGLITTGQLPNVLPIPAGSTLLAQVLRADGTVLSASPAASRTQPLAQPHGSRTDVGTDEEGGYAGTPLRQRLVQLNLDGQPVTVVVAAPLGDVRRAVGALRAVLLVVVPLLVLGAGAVVWWVAGRALRPVERLRAAAEELATNPSPSSEPEQLPSPPGDDEIARLGRTLNAMLSARQRVLQQQSDFVTAAAHELRSPLGSLQVQIDVAAAHPQLVVLPDLLEDLGHDIARLTSLADQLLALARLNARPDFDPQPVDLTALVGAEGEPVLVAGDEQSLRRLVDNLLTNARRHASRVQVTTAVMGGWAVLDVDDDGPGIPAADRERVFDRWVRLDESRSRDGGGFGLGLAIVRDIARTHQGNVHVLDSPLGGARLRLCLPVSG